MTDQRFERIRSIVARALQLEGTERSSYLQANCGDDAELRAEVEELLGTPGAERFATTGVEALMQLEATRFLEEVENDVLSSSVGEFRILRSLGRGGMGQVYLADQTAPVERRVALKMVRLGLDSTEVLARFRTESQALARMSHPNIARIYGAGTTGHGRPFFVMEYVEGASLLESCDQRQLTLRERLELFRSICSGLQHAHNRGVIHRDIKPSNILVTELDGVPVAKIIDFGISKPGTGDEEYLTQFGQLLGTPEYMSPEQADPSGDIDIRTDVYSLGVLLYELLAGSTPFDGVKLRKAGLLEVQRVLLHQDPPRPSNRLSTLGAEAAEIARRRGADLPHLVRALSGELDWIVLRAIEKDRDRRYDSPRSLADDIGRYLEDRPVMASPPSRVYRARKFVRRNRVGISIGTAILFGLLGAGGGLTSALLQSRQKQIETAEARDEAEAVTSFLTNMLQEVDPEESGKDVTVQELLDRSAETVHEQFGDRPLLEARLRGTIGQTYLRLTAYDPAREHLEWALDTRMRILGPNDPSTLWTLSRVGELQSQLSNYAEAESLLSIVLERRQAVLGPQHPQTIDSMNDLAIVYLELGEYDKAEPLFKSCIDYWTDADGAESIGALRARNTLANLYAYRGDAAASKVEYLRVIDAAQRGIGALHPLTLSAKSNLAMSYYDLGRPDSTEILLVEVLEGRRRTFAEGHRKILESSNNLAAFYSVQGRYAEAIPVMESGYEASRAALGEHQRDTLYVANNLGNAYMEVGRLDDAERMLDVAIAGRLETMGERHRDTLSSRANLAQLRRRQGRLAEAIEIHRDVLRLRIETLGESHAHTLLSKLSLGDALLAGKDVFSAASLLESALDGYQAELGADHPRTNSARLSVAELRGRQGRWGECEDLLASLLGELPEGVPLAGDQERVAILAAELYSATQRPRLAAEMRARLR